MMSATEEVSRNRGRPRKRQSDDDHATSNSRVSRKRRKVSYNDDYRLLYNDTVNELGLHEDVLDKDICSSQVGVTTWTAKEKSILFHCVAKHGKCNIRSIAADVGSKSESEVYIYLDHLQKASTNEQSYGSCDTLPRRHDFDAAVEIGQACCDRLDTAAEALSMLQQKEEEKLEQIKHGDVSILTLPIAKQIHRQQYAGKEDATVELVPAANLLHLKNFLTLSKRVFMNSSNLENNWRTYSEGRKNQVSILYTAFSDFYNLAISITKRLVQSALYCAMSRLRALNVPGRSNHGHHVRSLDVAAALSILGMHANSKSMWAKTARNCHLRVFEDVRHRKIYGRELSFDEVEETLSTSGPRTRGRSLTRSAVNPPMTTSFQIPETEDEAMRGSESPSGSEISSDSQSEVTEGSVLSDSPGPQSDTTFDMDKFTRKQQLIEEANEDYAEAFDQRESRKEEQRIWNILGEEPEDTSCKVDKIDLPKLPQAERKTKEDLIDWVDYVDHAQEWEMYDSPVPASSFHTNRARAKAQNRAVSGSSSSVDTKPHKLGRSSKGSSRQPSSNASIRNYFSAIGEDSDSDSHTDKETTTSRSRSLRARKQNPNYRDLTLPELHAEDDQDNPQIIEDGGDDSSEQSKMPDPIDASCGNPDSAQIDEGHAGNGKAQSSESEHVRGEYDESNEDELGDRRRVSNRNSSSDGASDRDMEDSEDESSG